MAILLFRPASTAHTGYTMAFYLVGITYTHIFKICISVTRTIVTTIFQQE